MKQKVFNLIILDESGSMSMTDGAGTKSVVESLKAKGWILTYIGVNQDVEKVASTISITDTLSFSADAAGTSAMFARESKARHRLFGDSLV